MTPVDRVRNPRLTHHQGRRSIIRELSRRRLVSRIPDEHLAIVETIIQCLVEISLTALEASLHKKMLLHDLKFLKSDPCTVANVQPRHSFLWALLIRDRSDERVVYVELNLVSLISRLQDVRF